MIRNIKTLLVVSALTMVLLSGCASDEDPNVRIVYVPTDDDLNAPNSPQRLADWIEDKTNRQATLFEVQDVNAGLLALASGQADLAFVDGVAGFYGWKEFGLEAVAADVNKDGRSFYVANAVVKTNSSYETFEDLRGATSCHTGLLKSAGMFMPLGWMVGQDLVDPSQFPDEQSSIVPLVKTFFDEAIVPESGAQFYNYQGALECLSVGAGDVAFVKDTTAQTFCGGETPESWCLPMEDYRVLQVFGNVPSHPVMIGDMSDAKRSQLELALFALNDSEEGKDILENVLETAELVPVTTEAHLGDYAANLAGVPGMGDYVDGKLH